MGYKVVVTSDAEKDFDRFIQYLLFEKKNVQAAQSVLNDFEATKKSLAQVVGSLKLCENPRLQMFGYRYFMLYRIEEDIVFIDNIFHELQDYENRMM